MLHVALVVEVLATIICIHCIHGAKIRWTVKTFSLIGSVLAILELTNYSEWGGIISLGAYVLIIYYCVDQFDISVISGIITLLLCMVIIIFLQFIFAFFVGIIISDENTRNALSNLLTLLSVHIFLNKCRFVKVRKDVFEKDIGIYFLASFICFVAGALLLQEKIFYHIEMQYFVLGIPAIIFIIYFLIKWYLAQVKTERFEKEMYKMSEHTTEFDDLLVQVRLRQHELKNHMAAIFSAHYTYKSYEQLVKIQDEYCRKLMDENKYNNLLMIDNNILAGYLYQKFNEANVDGIEIRYKVEKVENLAVPMFYVIEMIGILLDNAVEETKSNNDKTLIFEIYNMEEEYAFCVKNRTSYVPYDELVRWFELDDTKKGKGRGLGLFHLKKLCSELHCKIECRNIEIEESNWIEFVLLIKKDG